MPVRTRRITIRIALGLTSTFCAAWPLAAQEAGADRNGPVWVLEAVRSAQCVRFLMDPSAARKQMGPGTRLVRADQDQTLHLVLRSVISERPDLAAWTPAELCLFFSDAIRVGSRRVASKDARKKQMLGVWTVAATEEGGRRRDMVLDLFGSGGELARAGDAVRVKVREGRTRVSQVPATGNDLYDVRVGKTRLIWNGRAAGDSAPVGQPMEHLWLARGASGTFWRVKASFSPTSTRSLVGVLTVEGKDDLAKALKASPTRFVGPLYLGGAGELHFSR